MPLSGSPQTIPRRRPQNVFLRVTAAVLSGAAAMLCIESYKGAPDWDRTAATIEQAVSAHLAALDKRLLAPPAPKPVPAPAAAAPRLAPPKLPPRDESPAPTSMLVEPEPGGLPQGMLHAASDEPGTSEGEGPAAPEGRTRWPRLNSGGLGDRPAPFPPAAKPVRPAKVKTTPRLLEKKVLTAADMPGPALINPEAPPEKPFWTDERVARVWISGLLAVAGLLYTVLASGVHRALDEKPPEGT